MDPVDAIPIISGRPAGAMVATLIETMSVAIEKHRSMARSAYDRVCPVSGLSGAWHEAVGRESAILPVAGRFADLLVMTRPDLGTSSQMPGTLEAALFESGRPILILPAREVKTIGARVVVAWNGSVEAVHAVAASIPFLCLTSQVDVVTAGDAAKEAPASALVPYLARHDVKPAVHDLDAGTSSIGDALSEAALRLEADLLVMGAYGHSRLRERILGGATRELLANGALPVLMMH